MVRIGLTRFVVVAALTALLLSASNSLAQGPPLPPEVGNAVLLATNSIQVDRDVVVLSGDLVVNAASTGPILGEKDLSLDQGVKTPAGFALKANSVDIDKGALVSGVVYYNILQNSGSIGGGLVTPLSLPVFATLPQLLDGTVGTENIAVGNGQTLTLATGNYGNLTIGPGGQLVLSGGTYVFASITAESGSSIIWDGPGDVVVKGPMTLGSLATIGAGAGVTTKHKMFFVHGVNVSIGRDSTIGATIHAPNGSITVDQSSHVTGSLVARNIRISRLSTLELRSGFRNLPPVANSQSLTTNGTAPLSITLTGFDPDADPLTFAIVTPPVNGTLSSITPTGPSSAVVVYTPGSPDPDDAFVFRVIDSEGASAQAVVTINEGSPSTVPDTIIVPDASGEALQNRPTTLTMLAQAPSGVALTFSIVPGSGPSHGTLGPVTQPTQIPPQPATVVYVPELDYSGPDAFDFQACGIISGNQVCDAGTYSITVVATPTEPTELAPDLEVEAAAGVPVPIGLPTAPITSQGAIARFVLRPTAAIQTGAAVAGNVADSTADGVGDNHNALPGPAPGLMSAGVGQSGGAGSNGTTRMEFEWDISNLSGLADQLTSANVLLSTNRGTIDSLNTFFFWVGEDNDGLLTDDDYARGAEQISGVTMPVPPEQPVGADGTFSIDVLSTVRAAMKGGFTHFSIQGRVNETLTGGRGLQVYTTASGNLTLGREPQLGLATAGIVARTFRVLSLPSAGTLRDSNDVLITAVPYTLPSSVLFYHPPLVAALTSFTYEVAEGLLIDTGLVNITVLLGDCATDPRFCDTGRD